MLDGEVYDAVEAASLSFNRSHIHIYSASWGPDDDGRVVDGPGPLAKKSFENGIKYVRRRGGSWTLWMCVCVCVYEVERECVGMCKRDTKRVCVRERECV